MRKLLLPIAALILTACAPTRVVKEYVPYEKEVTRVVSVPKAMTSPIAKPEGPLRLCPILLIQKDEVIDQLNAKLLEISTKYGEL